MIQKKKKINVKFYKITVNIFSLIVPFTDVVSVIPTNSLMLQKIKSNCPSLESWLDLVTHF